MTGGCTTCGTDHLARDAMWGASGLSINDQPHSCLATCFRAIDFGSCYRAIVSCLNHEPKLATMSAVIYITLFTFRYRQPLDVSAELMTHRKYIGNTILLGDCRVPSTDPTIPHGQQRHPSREALPSTPGRLHNVQRGPREHADSTSHPG